MAIGERNYSGNNDNSSNKGLYEQTYYSRLRFRNENKGISISFRSGLLILEINETDQNYKVTPLIAIYLSPMKAYMLSKELKLFKEYLYGDKVKENVAFGVTAGMGEKITYIGFHTNSDREVLITIGKFDDKGQISESQTFTMRKDYNYSINFKDISKLDIDKRFNDEIELNVIHDLITDFGRNMNGAAGYAAADLTRYDQARVLRKLDPIYDKLGIERKFSGNGGGYSRSENNFLANTSGVSSKPTSVEEMEDLLAD